MWEKAALLAGTPPPQQLVLGGGGRGGGAAVEIGLWDEEAHKPLTVFERVIYGAPLAFGSRCLFSHHLREAIRASDLLYTVTCIRRFCVCVGEEGRQAHQSTPARPRNPAPPAAAGNSLPVLPVVLLSVLLGEGQVLKDAELSGEHARRSMCPPRLALFLFLTMWCLPAEPSAFGFCDLVCVLSPVPMVTTVGLSAIAAAGAALATLFGLEVSATFFPPTWWSQTASCSICKWCET